jgi:hypothetical protein
VPADGGNLVRGASGIGESRQRRLSQPVERAVLRQSETYLATCEAMAAEAAPTLIHERDVIAQIADNACLPESLNERAATLLAQIPEGK